MGSVQAPAWSDDSDCNMSSDEDSDEADSGMRDVASLLRHRQQQAPCVRLAGMIVPFGHQLEATGSDGRLPASADQVTAAFALLGVSKSASRSELNRARRHKALQGRDLGFDDPAHMGSTAES